jgi:ParB-like chromosome segregation protein Spo0J
VVPVLVDGANMVLAGHGRVKAALSLGIAEIPTITVAGLSGSQAKAFMLADNKLCENSSWDESLLSQTLKELSEIELDFNIEATGFEIAEIDLLLSMLVHSVPSSVNGINVSHSSLESRVSRCLLWSKIP